MANTQPTPPKFNMQDIIDMLMMNQNGKGGSSASDLNFLNNDVFGALTGTANDALRLSDEEAFQQYAPTTYSLQNGDENSTENIILGYMDEGNSAIKVKREVLALALPEQEQKLMLDLVDTLDKERNDYSKYARTPKVDAFTKMGLPHASERFTPGVDIGQDAFQNAMREMQSAQNGIDRRARLEPPLPIGNEDDEQLNLMKQQILDEWIKNKEGPFKFAAQPDARPGPIQQDPNNPNIQRLAINEAKNRLDEPRRQADRAMYVAFSQFSKQLLTGTPEQKALAQRGIAGLVAQQKAKQVLASNETNRKIGIGSEDRASSSMPVLGKDHPVRVQRRIMQLTSDKITSGLEAAGITPTNMALFKRLLAAKGVKNG